MRTALPIAFVIGLVLKVLHLPYHTVLLLAVLAVALVWCLRQLRRSTDTTAAWTGLAVWAWSAHLVALLKLFPFRTGTLVLAGGLTLVAVYLLIKDGAFRSRAFSVLAGVFILVMLIMAQPTSARFHFTNLAFSLERTSDVGSWDKYSFFLSKEGDVSKALEANEQAITMAKANGANDMVVDLEAHRALIGTDAWTRYDPLPVHSN